MRYFTYIYLFFFSFAYSQKSIFTDYKKDSTLYYFELAKFNQLNNDYNSTLKNIQQGLMIAESENNSEGQAKAFVLFGKVYQELNRPLEAIKNFNLSVTFYNEIALKPDLAFVYYEIGVCYIQMKNYTYAEDYFKKAEDVYSTLGIEGAPELINLQKGIVYYAKGENTIARNYLNAVVLNHMKKNN
jgi:tetratricopeptide (TPR) repeat protein